MAKFLGCARRIIDRASADRVLDLVEALDQQDGVAEIMSLVRG